MHSEDVIVGERYLWTPSTKAHAAFSPQTVTVEHARVGTNSRGGPKIRFRISAGGGRIVVNSRALSCQNKLANAARANELAQPHRLAVLEHKLRMQQLHGGPKELWEYLPASECTHLRQPTGREQGVIRFGHHLERAMAGRFETLAIEWSPEPVRFRFADRGSFVPDFYLPELDLYVELTSVDASHKRAKLDAMAIEHPKVRVIAMGGEQIDVALALDRPALLAMLDDLLAQEHALRPIAA
jgi:hypothetical protein